MNINILKKLLYYTKAYAHYLLLALICAIINVSFTLISPILIGDGIDFIISKNNVNFHSLLITIIYLIFTIIIASLAQWIMNCCINVLCYKTIQDIREDAFNKINKIPLKYIDSKAHGDIISRLINDIDKISNGLVQGFPQLFTGIITIIGSLLFMLSINIKITFVIILITPLSLFVGNFIAKHSNAMFKEQSEIYGEMSGYIEEMVTNEKLIKSFCYEDNSLDKFKEINGRLYKSGVKSQFFSSLTNPCTRFVNSIVYAIVGVISALAAIYGQLTIGSISCFLSYANQYTKPFNEISSVITELQASLASASRVFSLLDEKEEVPDKNNAKAINSCSGDLSFNNVYFSYNTNTQLIEDLNLKVHSGSKIAIVGPTGCGKTTLINLLMKFYDINSGEILLDGKNINDITKESYRKMFGMVLQDTWLYSASVKDNIAYGNSNATYDEIIEAAKAAHAHEFITKLPNGYNTIISNNGENISQGQKQLLCIARIMLAKPPVLILDEATSNIDTRTEILVQKAFNKIMEGRTSFIVAHRLSTIKEADLILVMNKGKIIEQGTHEALLKKGGFYYNIYNSQFTTSNI